MRRIDVSTRTRLLAMVLAAGVGFATLMLYRDWQEPPFRLLRLAYSKRRTLELRISGADLGNDHVERGPASGQPAELRSAEIQIQRHLEAHNNDPRWLHASGLAALLDGRFEEAVSTLELARDLDSRSEDNEASVLTDLASAYFGRARSLNRPIDMWMALEALGEALDLAPSSATALYNRALVCQKAFLYPNAVDAWRRFLAAQSSGPWADEARRQCSFVERQLQAAEPSSAALDDLAELRMDRAMRSGFAPEQAALAAELRDVNGDDWLTDALAERNRPIVSVLAAKVVSRAELQVDRYGSELRDLRSIARDGDALYVWAEFEKLFRVSHSAKIADCVSNVADLARICTRRRYPWFLTQILLERSACEVARGDFDGAETTARQALEIARRSSFPVAQLRADGFLTSYLAASGHYREAAALNFESLATFWSRPLPYARGQELFHDMVLANEGLGRWHTAKDAANAAAIMAMSSHVPVNEAVNRARWAEFAARLGLKQEALDQYTLSQKLFDGMANGPAVDQYRAFAEAFAALAGDRYALSRFEPIVRSSTNLFVVVSYLHTAALLAERSGQTGEARANLEKAIETIARGAASAHATSETLEWRDQLQSCYRDLVRITADANDSAGAARIWQDFLRADEGLQGYRLDSGVSGEGDPATVVTFARLGDRYGVWVGSGGEASFSWVTEKAPTVDKMARAYAALCSLPSTSWTEASAAGGTLYELLLGPNLRGAKHGTLVLIQPDSELARIPWAALAVAGGEPMGEAFLVATLPTPVSIAAPVRVPAVQVRRALIVAATNIHPTLRDAYPPLPGIEEEVAAVRYAFPFAEVLEGRASTSKNISAGIDRADALHYAGHAILTGPHVQLLVAPDTASRDQDGRMGFWWPGEAGGRLSLAVLSACSTGRYRDPEDPRPENVARALLLNGTRQVVATLWNADSSAASYFMQSFYRSLRGNRRPVAAAAQAMRETRQLAAWANPYYWASYSVFVRL